MNENDLKRKLLKADADTLSVLWKAHSVSILNLAFRILQDRDAAEDVLMDLFVDLPKTIQSFRGEASFSTWFYRMTVNACLMRIRKSKRHSELEELNSLSISENIIGGPDEVDVFDAKLLEYGLSSLPAETRSMLWLKDAEGLELKELSEIFNLPEGTLKSKLSRARQHVREILKEEKVYA